MKGFIDFNVDVGEGIGNEAQIIPLVSSVNIACGGHAGDEKIIKEVLTLAKIHNVRVGAHPSFPDKANFGRVPMNISFSDLSLSLKNQIDLLEVVANEELVDITYIKPHGALYHLACNEREFAQLLIELAGRRYSLMGLPNSLLQELCASNGVDFIKEGFSDRAYESNGDLRKRSLEGSVLSDISDVSKQVFDLIKGKITSFSGESLNLNIDSICFHGDHDGAEKLIKEVVQTINKEGIGIRS